MGRALSGGLTKADHLTHKGGDHGTAEPSLGEIPVLKMLPEPLHVALSGYSDNLNQSIISFVHKPL